MHPDSLERLRSDDTTRARTLRILTQSPATQPAVIDELERLLDDRTIAILCIPYRFGEMRVLAAEALAMARAHLGDLRPVRLAAVPGTLSVDGMVPLRQRAGLPLFGEPREDYARLRDGGFLPVADVVFHPRDCMDDPLAASGSRPASPFAAEVAALVAGVAGAGNARSAILAGLRAIDGIEEDGPRFRWCELEVVVGDPAALQAEATWLARARERSIVAAPEPVAAIVAGDDTSVLVLRYHAHPGERLVGMGDVALDASPAVRLRADLRALATEGLVHTGAADPRQWRVGSASGSIFLVGWGAVEAADRDRIALVLDSVDRIMDAAVR